MKRLKLNPWNNINSTLTRKLDRFIIVNIGPLLDFESLFFNRGLGLGLDNVLGFLSVLSSGFLNLKFDAFCGV